MKSISNQPSVIILANLHFYTYAALSLEERGYLSRYIFSIGTTKKNPFWARLLPGSLKRKLKTRDLSGLANKHVTSLWLPELIQRGLPFLGLISSDRGNLIGAQLFDWIASRYVNDCDVLHFINGLGLRTARKAKQQGSIIICDMRAEYPDFQQELLEDEYEKLGLSYHRPFPLVKKRFLAELDLSDYYIVPSSHAKKTYTMAGIAEDRIFVVPYGVELDHFDRIEDNGHVDEASYSTEPFRIIFAGQNIVRKGIHYLVEAFKALTVENKELLLVGAFPENQYRAYIENLVGDDERVRFIGQVPKVELKRYYNMASVFVLPSLADSFGLVTLEAMACNLPVIVTENSGSQEIVREGIDGYVIPIRDVSALTRQLHYLANHPIEREQMASSAYQRARQFTWEVYGNRIFKVYETILGMAKS